MGQGYGRLELEFKKFRRTFHAAVPNWLVSIAAPPPIAWTLTRQLTIRCVRQWRKWCVLLAATEEEGRYQIKVRSCFIVV